MKHPKHEVLQDYFENVLNPYHVTMVKEHLMDCDQCTNMLSHFAVIENKLKKMQVVEVTAATKGKIFADAKKMLNVRKEKQEQAEALVKERLDQKEKLARGFQEWKESIFPELKIPALQLCSLSIVLLVLVAVEKGQGSYEEMYEPLNSDVEVFTNNDGADKAGE